MAGPRTGACAAAAAATRQVAAVQRGRGRGGQEAGEDLGDEGFEGGEAGADDADVRFDAGPHRGRGVVPGDVGGDGDGVEGLEAEAGDDDDAGGGGS